MAIETHAYARAGFLGNPSDGYFGKIIALSVKNFQAKVYLQESHELMIQSHKDDIPVYKNMQELVDKVGLYGYYGGVRLIQAAVKRFYEYCFSHGFHLDEKNCALRYSSDIPRQLGLGGSSAIITAAFRALIEFYGIDIPAEILPTLILEAERDELGINAGFMDRVIQVYEGCMYMDLNKEFLETKGHGLYERVDAKLLPPLYLAYKPALGKISGQVLNGIRKGFDKGDSFVQETLDRIAEKAELGKKALLERDTEGLFRLVNENFDLRSQIMTISKSNFELIDIARRCGASSKFAGSGGSIIGMYRDEDVFSHLVSELGKIGAKVIKPIIE